MVALHNITRESNNKDRRQMGRTIQANDSTRNLTLTISYRTHKAHTLSTNKVTKPF